MNKLVQITDRKIVVFTEEAMVVSMTDNRHFYSTILDRKLARISLMEIRGFKLWVSPCCSPWSSERYKLVAVTNSMMSNNFMEEGNIY